MLQLVCVHTDAQIHAAVSNLVAPARAFKPDVIIAIGGGGFIPARMLRTELKVPVLAISLELYDDNTNTRNTTVKKTQWFDEQSGVGSQVRGKRVLIMDEVDDTRTTLAYAVREVMKTNAPSHIAVAVHSPHYLNMQSGIRILIIPWNFFTLLNF